MATKTKKTFKSVDYELKKKYQRGIASREWNTRLSSTEYSQRRLTFGKYINWMIKDLPIEYVKWGIMNLDSYWADFLRRELQKREPKWR